MSQFLKFLFASCLGTILALGVMLFILFIVAASSAPQQVIPAKSVLKIELNNVVPEHTDNIEQSGFTMSEGKTLGLHDIVKLIRKAKNDKNIAGLLIQTEMPQVRPATASYLSEVIKEFGDGSDKFVHAYGNYFTQSGYMIATSADSLLLNPNGLIDMRGYGTTIPYLKRFSEKTGINFDIYHAGKYKSAVEPYYLDKVSDANREQTHSFLRGYQDQLISCISKARELNEKTVREIIVHGQADNANAALQLGLVDKLSYFEDYEESLQDHLDVKKVSFISLEEYDSGVSKNAGSSKNKIAIIYAEGTVAGGGDARGEINMEVYEKVFEKIEKNKKIKTLVLRINSGGGSAFTSDVFLDRIQDIQDKGIKVIASFGDYAASGGYYIAASADYIFAEPTTLTGSIGVFAMMPNFNEFFDKHLGINWDTIGTGAHTFMYSPFIEKSAQDNIKLKNDTERIYAEFKKIVSDGRGLTLEEVETLAQGRVWTGIQGLENGLVDEIGNMDEAIAYAVEQAEIDDYKLIQYPLIKKTFWEEMISNFASTANTKLSSNTPMTSKLGSQITTILSEVEAACETPQARMPIGVMVD